MAGPVTGGVRKENAGESRREFPRHGSQVHHDARANRTLHGERVAVKMVIPFECLDEQKIHRKPYRPAPVGIPAEQTSRGFAGRVVHTEFLCAKAKHERMRLVHTRHGADAKRREKLRVVEQVPEHAGQPLARRDREQPVSVSLADLLRGSGHVRNVTPEVGPIAKKPFHPLPKARQPCDDLVLDDLAREQRHQPNEGANAKRCLLPIHVQHVVIEAVLLVPEAGAAQRVHGIRDGDEVLEELRRNVLVRRILARQLERDRQHRVAVERHPGRAVGLLELSAGGQRLRPVEDPDVIEAEEPAGEKIVAVEILPVHPPGEVDQQFLKNAGKEDAISTTARARHLVHAPRGPGVHGWIHIVERPLVRGKLAVRVHVPLTEHQRELFLGELRIHHRHRYHVKGEIPRREPWVLPLVRHRQHIGVIRMPPFPVPAGTASHRCRWMCRVTLEPFLHRVVIELFRPEQSGVRLPRHAALLIRQRFGDARPIELVGLADACRKHVVHGERSVFGPLTCRTTAQPQVNRSLGSSRNRQDVVRCRLGSHMRRIHRVGTSADDTVVKRILHVRRRIGGSEQPLRVALVLRKEQHGLFARRRRRQLEDGCTERGVRADDAPRPVARERRLGVIALAVPTPAPGVAIPERRQQMQRRGVRPAIGHGDANADVVRRRLRILGKHVEVPALVEDAGISQLVLAIAVPALGILGDEILVRIGALRILVQRLHV